MKDYLESAGGFTTNANKFHITIVHANGEVKIKKLFRSPIIREGTTIIVQQKDESEPFDLTEFISNTASLVTTIATILLLFGR